CLPEPTVAMGDRKLPVRVQAAGARLAKSQPPGDQDPGDDPPARVRGGSVDAGPARLLSDPAADSRPAQHPLAARRRVVAGSRGSDLPVARLLRRADAPRLAVAGWAAIPVLPGDRCGDVPQRD